MVTMGELVVELRLHAWYLVRSLMHDLTQLVVLSVMRSQRDHPKSVPYRHR